MVQIKLPVIYDTSHWKVIPDFALVDPRPRLVLTKATEGTRNVDPTFIKYFADLLQDRIRRGCFHFFRKATKTGIYCVAFRNNGNDRSYVKEYIVNTTNTWQKVSLSLTLDQTGGTESYSHLLGLSIFWALAGGSTFQTTANAWQNGNFIATSNQVNACDNTANDFFISQVKLERYDFATPFRPNSFLEERQACLRHFYKTFEYAITPATSAGTLYGFRWPAVTAGATAHRPPSLVFPVPMRIAPTITFFNPSAGNAQVRDVTGVADCTATAVGAVSEVLVDINCTGAAGTAVGNSMIVCLTAEAGF